METTWRQHGDSMETEWRQNGDNNRDKVETKWRQIGDRREQIKAESKTSAMRSITLAQDGKDF